MLSLNKILNLNHLSKIPLKFRNSSNNSICYPNYKHSCKDMRRIQKDELKTFYNHLECIITDADGVLWLNEVPIKGSVQTFNWFGDSGKNSYIVTNSSNTSRKSLHKKATAMGINIKEDRIIGANTSTALYLKSLKFNKKVYVIGSKELGEELCYYGIEHLEIEQDPMCGSFKSFIENFKLQKGVGAVVVGFDEFFSYPKLTKACHYLTDPKCLFIAPSTDDRGPSPTIILPGGGCFVKAIETYVKRSPVVIGKPSTDFIKRFVSRGLINPSRTLMIGDRGSTDILFGQKCCFYTLLVLTGTDTLEDVKEWKKDSALNKQLPDFFLPSMADLQELINN